LAFFDLDLDADLLPFFPKVLPIITGEIMASYNKLKNNNNNNTMGQLVS